MKMEANNSDFDEQEKELLKQLAEIRAAREKAKAIAPMNIAVQKLSGAYVIISLFGAYRQDVKDTLDKVSGRIYQGSGKYGVPVGYWLDTYAKLEKLENVTIGYEVGIEKEIRNHLNAPIWEVELAQREIKMIPGPKAQYFYVNKIPGSTWRAEQKAFFIPMSEAWRIPSAMENVDGVVYSEEATAFISDQLNARSQIDEIAKAKDWPDWNVTFKDESVTLRPVQKVAGKFIEATGGRTLLAFQMGLGKTIISLAYAIKHNLKTLIICPASLKANWAREIVRLTGKKPYVLIGTEPTDFDLKHLMFDPDVQFVLTNYDIISKKTEYDDITTDQEGYQHSKHVTRFLWIDVLNLARFPLAVVDESHYIKNTDSNRSQAIRNLKTEQLIHMTGTPVLNRPGELWPMLTMISPEVFPAEDTFIRQYTIDGKVARNVEELKEVLRPIMIRRKQSDVVDELPPLNRITEWHELSSKAKKLYNKALDGIYEEIAAFDASRANRYTDAYEPNETSITSILAKIQRLKMICAYDKVAETADLATQLQDSASEEKHNKILIFSQYKAVAYSIAQRLGHEALCFVSNNGKEYVTADYQERDDMVQQFQNNPNVKYLVVTEKTAKEGHNLTEAGYVIFNDLFWTPAGHEQGEGRAYMRINDPHGITSYYIISEMNGEGIEEWIWQMLHRKMTIIEQTVEGVESSRDVSIANELISKLRESMWTRKRN